MSNFQWLIQINQYSNLLLVVITAFYVVLTWRMVKEMRKARESEIEPYVVSSLNPYGPAYAQIRIDNIGRGPALNVKVRIAVHPNNDALTRVWQHPVMLPDSSYTFLLPSRTQTGSLPSIRQLTDEYSEISTEIDWINSFGRKKRNFTSFNLQKQIQGWYNAGHIMPPEDTTTQIKNICDAVEKVGRELHDANRHLHSLTIWSTENVSKHPVPNRQTKKPRMRRKRTKA